MKKIIKLIALISILSFVGCGESSSSSAKDNGIDLSENPNNKHTKTNTSIPRPPALPE